MATIARTTKAGSGTGDFATGTVISATEANADLNAIYNEFNGNIAAVNLDSNAVTTAKILDANVTTAKLAIGATYPDVDTGVPVASLLITTAETTVVTLGSITTRGGRVLLHGMISWSVIAGVATTQTVTIRIKRNAVTQLTYTIEVQGPTALTVTVPLPSPCWEDAPTAGTYTYIITAQTSDANVGVTTPGSNPGLMIVRELA